MRHCFPAVVSHVPVKAVRQNPEIIDRTFSWQTSVNRTLPVSPYEIVPCRRYRRRSDGGHAFRKRLQVSYCCRPQWRPLERSATSTFLRPMRVSPIRRPPENHAFLENICLGAAAVGYRTESMHGAGSPQAQRIMISVRATSRIKRVIVKIIAGIKNPIRLLTKNSQIFKIIA